MQINNTSDQEHSLYHDALRWARANSTNYPFDPDFVRDANFALDKVTQLILNHDNSWEWDDNNRTDLPVGTASLVSAQQDYSLPVTHLKVIRVRAKDSAGNWVTLQPISRRSLSDSELSATGVPRYYDKLASSIFLTPTPNYASSGGLEVQFQRPSDYFVVGDTSKEPGFASVFHRLISLYPALDYTEIHSMDAQSAKIRNRIEKMEAELVEFYSSRDYDKQHSLSLRKEDYGGHALSGTIQDNPKGFNF
jgi:hypothetical protein